jgi:hypothetical protein
MGYDIHSLVHVTIANDQGHVVKDFPVNFNLTRQSGERVTIALQLVPRELSIDDGHVHSHGAGPNAHLFHNTSVRVGAIFRAKPIFDGGPDVRIPHDTLTALEGVYIPLTMTGKIVRALIHATLGCNRRMVAPFVEWPLVPFPMLQRINGPAPRRGIWPLSSILNF